MFEIELIEGGIKVKEVEYKDGNIVATLEVKYEKEIEDRDGDEESKIFTETITWSVKPVISSNSQINQIKEMITNVSSTNDNIDISDLKEYFLGEKDDDDFDDIGVFDRIAKLNNDKKLNNLGGLLGYELKLGDIFNQLVPPVKIDVNLETPFFAPSAALNNTFIYPSESGSLNYELNINALGKITKEEIVEFTTSANLASIIIESDQEKLNQVSEIIVEDFNELLKVTVTFKEANKNSEVISINPNLLLQK